MYSSEDLERFYFQVQGYTQQDCGGKGGYSERKRKAAERKVADLTAKL